MATVNPIFTWVRLAQRIPVRIHIDEVPPGVVLSAGMTATVEIDGPTVTSLSVLTLACVEADRDLDESEALLKRAMEMVRAPTRSSRRVVRIEYDRGESAYVAKDTETGHVVIRHNDRTRLRIMCEQFHWKMVEGEPPNVQTE